MSRQPRKGHHFKLHHCKQDNHYHIILGQDNISWPFWSLESALKMVEFTRSIFTDDFAKGNIPGSELEFGDNQLHLIEEQIRIRSHIQNIGLNGQFAPGFLMPRKKLFKEGNVAKYWAAFLREEIPYMGYIHEDFLGSYFTPLYCDFISRSHPRPERATRKGWEWLAQEKVTRITMEELGIQLEPLN